MVVVFDREVLSAAGSVARNRSEFDEAVYVVVMD